MSKIIVQEILRSQCPHRVLYNLGIKIAGWLQRRALLYLEQSGWPNVLWISFAFVLLRAPEALALFTERPLEFTNPKCSSSYRFGVMAVGLVFLVSVGQPTTCLNSSSSQTGVRAIVL